MTDTGNYWISNSSINLIIHQQKHLILTLNHGLCLHLLNKYPEHTPSSAGGLCQSAPWRLNTAAVSQLTLFDSAWLRSEPRTRLPLHRDSGCGGGRRTVNETDRGHETARLTNDDRALSGGSGYQSSVQVSFHQSEAQQTAAEHQANQEEAQSAERSHQDVDQGH